MPHQFPAAEGPGSEHVSTPLGELEGGDVVGLTVGDGVLSTHVEEPGRL